MGILVITTLPDTSYKISAIIMSPVISQGNLWIVLNIIKGGEINLAKYIHSSIQVKHNIQIKDERQTGIITLFLV